jgi:hypothetical protein
MKLAKRFPTGFLCEASRSDGETKSAALGRK